MHFWLIMVTVVVIVEVVVVVLMITMMMGERKIKRKRENERERENPYCLPFFLSSTFSLQPFPSLLPSLPPSRIRPPIISISGNIHHDCGAMIFSSDSGN